MTGGERLAVLAGGAIGAVLRWWLDLVVPALGDVPLATLAVNVLGAGLLGLVVGLLADRAGRTVLRSFLTTGLLGAFTTYSALAVETLDLLGTTPALAVAYAGGSLVLGQWAATVGLRAGGAET